MVRRLALYPPTIIKPYATPEEQPIMSWVLVWVSVIAEVGGLFAQSYFSPLIGQMVAMSQDTLGIGLLGGQQVSRRCVQLVEPW